jgi:ubiquinone/menaquinone biosynthesis C-methylase UbiE
MTVVEPGCGMGYFTLPLARLVGPQGRVVCVDLQPRMIASLRRRATRAGLLGRIDASVCTATDLGLARHATSADVAFAIHMVHEVPDPGRLLAQLREVLKPGSLLVIVEPKGHVSAAQFGRTLELADQTGFTRVGQPDATRGHAVVLRKPAPVARPNSAVWAGVQLR